MSREGREPAVSERTSRLIAGAFAFALLAALFAALVMILGWALLKFWQLLFG